MRAGRKEQPAGLGHGSHHHVSTSCALSSGLMTFHPHGREAGRQEDKGPQSTGSKNRLCLSAGSGSTGCVTLDKVLTSLCLSSSFLRQAKNSTYLRTVTGLDELRIAAVTQEVASQRSSSSTAPEGGPGLRGHPPTS